MKKIVQPNGHDEYDDRYDGYYDEDDFDDGTHDDWDEDDYEERRQEELAEIAFNCKCGAWQFNKERTKVLHVADCICGAE